MKKIVLGCAAVLLSLGLLAGCNNEDDKVSKLGPEENDNGEDDGSKAETTLVKLGGYTEPTGSYHYASETNASSGIETVDTWESAPWITVTKVTGGATLSVEVSGVTEYLTWASGTTTISWGEEVFTWSWNEDIGTFGVFGDSSVQSGARYLGLSSDSSETPYVRAYATSGSYVAVVPYTAKPEDVVLPTSYTEVTTIEDGESYLLGIELGEEGSKELYFFNGKITGYYYLSVASSYLSAVEVTTTAIENETEASEWGLSFELDGAAKEIYAYQGPSSSTEGKYYEDLGICEKGATPEDHNATKTFTWDSTTYSFSVTFGDDSQTTKILGLESSSTFKEIALVDATQEVEEVDDTDVTALSTTVDNLRAHLYSPVFDTEETPAE